MRANTLVLSIAAAISGLTMTAAHAGTLADGNFSNWSLFSIGNGSMTLEASGGNPGARLNATTFTVVGGPTVYDVAIKPDFTTSAPLSGSFTLGLQILSGPGDFGAGQAIGLVLQQGIDVYYQSLGTTGSGHAGFDSLSFNGTFTAASFAHLSGSGAASPNLAGGAATTFGFAAVNSSNNRSVTEYYDNFALTAAAVPESSSALLLGAGLGVAALARLGRRAAAASTA